MDDLIVRARRVAEVGGVASSCVLLELADRVESLADDNRRLRAACEPVAAGIRAWECRCPQAAERADILRRVYLTDTEATAVLEALTIAPAAAGGEGT